MSALDIILIVFLVIGMSSGYRKGFLVSLFSLLAIFLGIVAGFKLMGTAMITLGNHYEIDEKLLPYAAFGLVFVVVVILVNLLGNLLKSTLDKTLLGSADQMAGAALGLFKTAFMLSVVFWILDSLALDVFHRWIEHSWLYPHLADVAPAVTEWAGDLFPEVGNILHSHD